MTVERIWPDYLHVVELALAPDAAASAARRLMAYAAYVLIYETPEPHNFALDRSKLACLNILGV